MKVGIVGAGKFGTALGRRAVAAGHEVLVAGRPGAPGTALVLDVMVPGALATPVSEWTGVDVAVLAVPLSVALRIDLPMPAGTVVVDATNHWPPVDGDLPELAGRNSTQAVAERHPTLRWAKSLNHMGYHDLEEDRVGTSRVPTPAIGIASDDSTATATAADLIASLGFEPVLVGPLSAGALLEAGGPLFGTVMDAHQMRVVLQDVSRTGDAPVAHRPRPARSGSRARGRAPARRASGS